jgi:hypothetical protein
MFPVTVLDPARPCLADPTPLMTMTAVDLLADTALAVKVTVREAHPVVATMTMIAVVVIALLPELVARLMTTHPRVAVSRTLTAASIHLTHTPTAEPHMTALLGTILQEIILVMMDTAALLATSKFPPLKTPVTSTHHLQIVNAEIETIYVLL